MVIRGCKVIHFGANRNRQCNFLSVHQSKRIVLSCTFSEILQVFVLLTPAKFHPNFESVPVAQIAHIRVNVSSYLKLMSHKIIYELFRHM